MLKIAITGNIASGKSEVEKMLAEKGFTIYDTDKLAHDVLDGINDFYGYDVFTDGKIDRKKLGNLVFKENNIKKKLEELVHPKIKEKILELFEKHKNDDYVFISVPLLYEAGFEQLFDKVLLIYIDKNIQLTRLMNRNNFTEEEALKRINSQLSYDEKVKKADYTIDNSSDIYELQKNVETFCENLSRLTK